MRFLVPLRLDDARGLAVAASERLYQQYVRWWMRSIRKGKDTRYVGLHRKESQ